MRFGVSHAALLAVAAAAFLMGIEWLYMALGILFLALVFAEYSSEQATVRVPPPPPAPPAGVQPVFVQQGTEAANFVTEMLSDLVSNVVKPELEKEARQKEQKALADTVSAAVKSELEKQAKKK
ncbi:MAG: hypothetical protein NTY90_05365 [Candidatus Micrarchaeota archaeon]|nr:hypothetical protein [Candidatus Micrarchaeota archaeon]